MKRFRFTFLAVCLLLTWLGSGDLILQLRNQQPMVVALENLPPEPLPQEWFTLTGGHLDLLQAINMTGTIEIDAFLVPLVDQAGATPRVWVETRNPQIIKLLTHYHFKLEQADERAAYLAEHQAEFFPQKKITGMTADNVIANNNRAQLLKLLTSMGLNPAQDVVFISEGKTPNVWRGPAFLIIAALGVIRFILWHRKRPTIPKQG